MSFGGGGTDRITRTTMSAIRRPRPTQPSPFAVSATTNNDNALQTLQTSIASSLGSAAGNYNANTLSSNEFLFGSGVDRASNDERIDELCSTSNTTQNMTSFLPKGERFDFLLPRVMI